MNLATFLTYSLANVGDQNPSTIARASSVPMRVVVSNVGPAMMFVADASGSLAPEPSVQTFRIAPGDTQVFVLAPQQTLYAISSAAGGQASVACSDAWPSTT